MIIISVFPFYLCPIFQEDFWETCPWNKIWLQPYIYFSIITAMIYLIPIVNLSQDRETEVAELRQGQRCWFKLWWRQGLGSLFSNISARSLNPSRWPLLYQGKAFTMVTKILTDIKNRSYPKFSLWIIFQNLPTLYFKYPLTLLSVKCSAWQCIQWNK